MLAWDNTARVAAVFEGNRSARLDDARGALTWIVAAHPGYPAADTAREVLEYVDQSLR